jgi:hypothetical protein
MSEPTCRACYAATLTPDERQRFYAEPVTSCIYWCADHERAMEDVLNSLPQVQFIKATTAMFEPPMFTPTQEATDADA